MFKNYFVTTYRNLLKTKTYSLISVLGLAIGMTACLLILHFVRFEESYDTFHNDSDRIYRLRYERTDGTGESVKFASCTPPAAARIRGKYPDVENIGRTLHTSASVSFADKVFLEDRVFYAEPELFSVLSFPFVQGDPQTGLAEPDKTCISASIADKYFGDTDPIGKTISLNKRMDYEIVGVFEDLPANSHVKMDIILPWKNLETLYGPDYTEAWGHTGSYTYLKTAPNVNSQEFETKLQRLVEAECPWLKEYNMTIDLKMQPLTDIHLMSHFMQEFEPNGDRSSVEFLFIIAFFIILMAWVNYVNLSTACSLRRAKEVGLRKVVGASRGQLIGQFFLEIVVINLVSIAIAFGVISLALPYFCQITGIPASISVWSQSWFWVTSSLLFFAGIFLSGLYPVTVLSSFEPVKVLKGRLGNAVRGINLRKALVVFQFTVGLFLLIATFTVYKQLSYMHGQELGFSMEQKLVIKAPRVRDESYAATYTSFKESLLKIASIDCVTYVTEVPGRQIYWDAGGIRREGQDENQGKNYQIVGVDYDFVDVFLPEIVAGRSFSREFPSDEMGLMLNETAVTFMGFEDAPSAVGQKVNYWDEIFTVIGVLKDYHQQSLKEEFEPHLFRYMPTGRGRMGMIAMTMNIENVQKTMAGVQSAYNEFFPGNSFDYFFLDDYYNEQYKADELFGQVYTVFAVLAIFITALGLFGLSSFSITRLTKEIGIRKVLGASVPSLYGLLTKEFLILLAIANAIAVPFSYYLMNGWLEGFAYRTDMGSWVFVLAGVVTLLIALMTVSYQIIRAARANPIDAIQHE